MIKTTVRFSIFHDSSSKCLALDLTVRLFPGLRDDYSQDVGLQQDTFLSCGWHDQEDVWKQNSLIYNLAADGTVRFYREVITPYNPVEYAFDVPKWQMLYYKEACRAAVTFVLCHRYSMDDDVGCLAWLPYPAVICVASYVYASFDDPVVWKI